MSNIIKTFNVPADVRKRTNLAFTQFYDKLDIYDNKMVGSNNGVEVMTWQFKEYTNIQVIDASLNSQFARIVFVTSANGNQREILLSAMTNVTIQGDMNKILFCSGMFSYKKANDYAKSVFDVLYGAFNDFKENSEVIENVGLGNNAQNNYSCADELKKFKDLLDSGAITLEEYNKKKKELLNL